MVDPMAAFDQPYVDAPLAVKIAVLPEIIGLVLLVTVTVGLAKTVTVTVAVEVHPPEVPVTVKEVVADGCARTVDPDV